MISLDTLKNAGLVRNRGTILKVLMNPRILVLIGVLFFTIFSIGGDTVLGPNLTKIKAQDDMIKNSRQQLDQKQLERKRVVDLESELKNLTTQLIPVASGNSPTVVAVSESSEILKIAKGSLRPEKKMSEDGQEEQALPKPHDTRENVSLTPTSSETIDITKALESSTAPSASIPSPSPGPSPGGPNGSPPSGAVATALNAYQFNYELKATGTYAALIDLINELALRRHLVKFSKITIVPSTNAHQAIPDATDDPDFPVKLDLDAVISIYLYDAPDPSAPQ
jgi:hypothetical protein